MAKFSPASDIGDLSTKVILVTGGTNGLGYESVLEFSKHKPSKIYLAARNEEKAHEAIRKIKSAVPDAQVEFLHLDLASLKSVKAAAEEFMKSSEQLDVLMNNAGVMACPPELTTEGYEIQFGTNHFGHALLTKLLLPTLQRTAKQGGGRKDVRIVNLSSEMHTWAPKSGIVYADTTTTMSKYSAWTRYGQSKLANLYFTRELARRYPEITSVAIHPGGVDTGLLEGPSNSYPWLRWLFSSTLARRILVVPVQEGVRNQLWASVSPDVQQGHFYYPVAKDFPGSALVRDQAKATELWDWTEAQLKSHGY